MALSLFGKTLLPIYCPLKLELVASFPIRCGCTLGMHVRWQGTPYSILTFSAVTARIRGNQKRPVRKFSVWIVAFYRRFLLSLGHNLMPGSLRPSLVRIVFPQLVV